MTVGLMERVEEYMFAEALYMKLERVISTEPTEHDEEYR